MSAKGTPTEHVVAHVGSQLHAWLTGPDGGPLIALSHGASMDHRMFDEQIGPLTDAGYRVLAWTSAATAVPNPSADSRSISLT